ncbi:chromodomain-helicase [Echria macrotheca]|uniref:Chromodomain-helicase n=1 Tax=Echria macrotheca TaxID=438768 RepID=A0AAJ0BDK6_9PEZI|nr:chromodomain-helicase [Echria macrotheca]
MAGPKGLPSSDDELVHNAFEEPVRYEFQSYLSDDAESADNVDDDALETAPDQNGSHHSSNHGAKGMDSESHVWEGQEDDGMEEDALPVTSHTNGTTNGIHVGDSGSEYDIAMDETINGVETDSPSDYAGKGTRPVDIEVVLDWIDPEERDEYEAVDVDDEPVSKVTSYSPRRLRKRKRTSYDETLYAQINDLDMAGTKKRRRKDDDADFDGELDLSDAAEEEAPEQEVSTLYDWDYGPRPRLPRTNKDIGSYSKSSRTSRSSSRLPSADVEIMSNGSGRGHRSLRLRTQKSRTGLTQFSGLEEKDELQDSDGDENDFIPIQSDIAQAKRGRPRLSAKGRRLSGRATGPQVEADARRSSRANKYSKTMTDAALDDDEIFYVDEEKAPVVRKTVASVREVFPQSAPADFIKAHRKVCDTCNHQDNPNKGPLVYCQGCSVSQHKGCLGTRSVREQRVTKVGDDFFVLQCKFCLRYAAKRDERAPHWDTCQGCHEKGPSCAPFSEKKTPKEEEALRKENDGVDPITKVDPSLINNAANVLFRCTRCHRAWHDNHLPPHGDHNPAGDEVEPGDAAVRGYRDTWQCNECREFQEPLKIDKIVAWRPRVASTYKKGQNIDEFGEDDVEYLVKWVNKSYNHCVWVPGGWVFGVASPLMRKKFYEKAIGATKDEEDEFEGGAFDDAALKWTEKEAIHESWITPEIILNVKVPPLSRDAAVRYKRMTRDEKFEHDLYQVLRVTEIYVKFEGLSYEDAVWDTPPDASSGRLWEAFEAAYREYLNGKHFQNDSWKNMKERLDEFRTKDFSTQIQAKKQPAGLRPGCQLMDYQLDGLNWMLYKFRHNENVILADEMGLGKTIQVVALLTSLILENPRIFPFLIVVPNATCANWRREIKKWAPELRVVAYYGGSASQNLAWTYELFPAGTSNLTAHVVIMSYESVKNAANLRVKWAGLIVDEAQALKNDSSARYKALTTLQVPFKLLLTGTPLQNNKRELFSLLHFIDPTKDPDELDKRFEKIDNDNLSELHDIIRPYFLRRTKAGVLKDLPPMAQIIVPVSMSTLQERLCRSILDRSPELIKSLFSRNKMKITERTSLNNIVMQLRKCLCHPFIYSRAIEDLNVSPEAAFRNLVQASSKLVLLEIMLPKLQERGHRVLIFSQLLEEMTILEDFLNGLGFKYERLDGSHSSLEKQKRIDAFNAPNSKLFAMLLSTRAGGVGINLATADTVIILDPDWNPHQDIQAISRAHRFGQKKKVLCFQIMTVDSVEERMIQIGREKMALDHLLVSTMDEKEADSRKDLVSVLKHSAAALYNKDPKKAAISYDADAIDKLLDRSAIEETKQNGEKSTESVFSSARIWAQDGELADDIETEDREVTPDVWNDILKQREEEARKEAEKHMEILGRGGRRRNNATYTTVKLDFDEGQEVPHDSEESADDDFVGEGQGSDGESTDGEKSRASGGAVFAACFRDGIERPQQHPKNTAEAGKSDSSPKNKWLTPVNSEDEVADLTAGTTKPAHANHLKDGSAAKPEPRRNPQPAQPVPRRAAQPDPQRTAQPIPQRGVQPGGSQPPQRITPVPPPLQPPQRSSQPGWSVPGSSGPKPAAAKAPAVAGSGAGPGAAAAQAQKKQAELMKHMMANEPCIVCGFLHPVTWDCPEMSIESRVRLALDKLRTTPAKDPQRVSLQKAWLTGKLAQLRTRQSGGYVG